MFEGCRMNAQEFTMESLKNTQLQGYLIFTDAIETGDEENGIIVITDETRSGVDIALMDAGFRCIPDRDIACPGMYWMQRKENEVLRYHPLVEKKHFSLMTTAKAEGCKTRIDFFCSEKSDVAYDVVSALLKLGYKVLVPFQDKLFLIASDPEQKVLIKEVVEKEEPNS